MDFPAVQKILDDLPTTFKRPGPPYRQWVDALSAGLYRLTESADGTASQLAFPNAQFGWLDLWGTLFNVPRILNESDQIYAGRIIYTVTIGGGPGVVICNWIKQIWGQDSTVTDNPNATGYTVAIQGSLPTSTVLAILQSLIYARPAGVPFVALISSNIGPYLDTVNFLDAALVTGAYLGAGTVAASGLALNPATNNAPVLLPDLFLTDPTLNPSLSVQV